MRGRWGIPKSYAQLSAHGEGISGAAFYQRWLWVITPAEVKPLGMTGNYLALVAGDGVPADAVFRV